jgi:poly(3-hydroxyalkanoate) synthetase
MTKQPTITEALTLPGLLANTKRSLEFYLAQRKQATSPLAKKVIDRKLNKLRIQAMNESLSYGYRNTAQG